MKNNCIKTLLAGMLVICLSISGCVTAFAVPGLDMKITQKNVLAVMDIYDPDDAFILREATAQKEDFIQWWDKNNTFLERIATSVHESTHVFCYRDPGVFEKGVFKQQNEYYLGGGKSQAVKFTDVFHTSEMADSIPKENRTMRYKVYVGVDGKENLASDVDGVYGLMNEFTAYWRSLYVMVSLYDYLFDQNASANDWLDWYALCENYRLSFAEFHYYILFYMTYAKEHHPDDYKSIMKNGSFLSAYRSVEKNYKESVDRYDELLKEMCSRLQEQGKTVKMKDGFLYIGMNGRGGFVEDYNKLVAACQSLQEAADALNAVEVGRIDYEEDDLGSDGSPFSVLIAALRARWESAKAWIKQAFEQAREWLEQTKEKIVQLFPSTASTEAGTQTKRSPCSRWVSVTSG